MLNSKLAHFTDLVWAAAAKIGKNRARVADEILKQAFPRTCEAADHEGADKMLRTGVILEIGRILRGGEPDADQHDFSEIDAKFLPLVKGLRSRSYFVEAAEEYVAVADLINDPAQLDDARKHMRRKGMECLDEAQRLDRLYAAVTQGSFA